MMNAVWIALGVLAIYFVISTILYRRKLKKYDPADASEHIVNLNDTNFDNQIKSGVTLVDFWAAWCAPCKVIAPIIDELANEMHESAKIAKLDVDKNQKSAAKFKVRNIPTLIVFKDGKEVERIVGVKPKHYLKKAIEKVL